MSPLCQVLVVALPAEWLERYVWQPPYSERDDETVRVLERALQEQQ